MYFKSIRYCPQCRSKMELLWHANRFLDKPTITKEELLEGDQIVASTYPNSDSILYKVIWVCHYCHVKITDYFLPRNPKNFIKNYDELN